jgi:uncharacterized protein (DUF433 family)
LYQIRCRLVEQDEKKGTSKIISPTEASFMTKIHQMQNQLAEALDRIQHLEEEINSGQESPRWEYLIARPHRWRRQLSIKGRNMTVGQLVSTIQANRYTPEQAGEELELPLAAINEALAYHAEHRDLIEIEASEERRRVGERGYPLEPKDLSR